VICRHCHKSIDRVQGAWVCEEGIIGVYCPNAILGLHWPFNRDDAILALAWVWGELSSEPMDNL